MSSNIVLIDPVLEAKDKLALLRAIPHPTYPDFVDNDGELDLTMLFLHLTLHTTPDSAVTHHRALLESFGFGLDKFGNMAHYNNTATDKDGNTTRTSRAVFAAHVDTADRGQAKAVTHAFRLDAHGNLLIGTDGKTLLGADDKAGMVVLLNMVHKGVPGLYYMFRGEEAGRLGSSKAAKEWDWETYNQVVCFDRHSEDSIITHQSSTQGVSKAYIDAAVAAFKKHGVTFREDSGGSFTDSYSFYDMVPECVNFSVGYEGAHGVTERQNMTFLQTLADAAVEVEWEKLPIDQGLVEKRDKKSWNTTTYYSSKMSLEDLRKKQADGTVIFSDIETYIRTNGNMAQRIVFAYLFGENWMEYAFKLDGRALKTGDLIENAQKDVLEVVDVTEYGVRLRSFTAPASTPVFIPLSGWRANSKTYTLVLAAEEKSEAN